jgi:hypothetical protein
MQVVYFKYRGCTVYRDMPEGQRTTNLWRNCQPRFGNLSYNIAQVFQALRRAGTRIGRFLDPDGDGNPRTRTVVTALVCLAVYLVVGGAAIKYADQTSLVVLMIVSVAIEVIIVSLVLADTRGHSRFATLIPASKANCITESRHYRRNVANTVLTVFSSVLVMTALYATLWHPAQNSWAIEITSDEQVLYYFIASFIMTVLCSIFCVTSADHGEVSV